MKIFKHPPATNTHILSFPSLEGIVHAFLDTNVLFDCYETKNLILWVSKGFWRQQIPRGETQGVLPRIMTPLTSNLIHQVARRVVHDHSRGVTEGHAPACTH
jgi:hypothetical protein